MKTESHHPWNLSPHEAMELQKKLASKVRKEPLDLEHLELIAGADVSFSKGDSTGYAAVVVMEYPRLKVLEVSGATGDLGMPYIPGLLSFREAPLILQALEKLKYTPQVILVDGNGIAHPRGLGIASHLGVLLDVPTIGCAKTRLLGHHEAPGSQKGNWVPWHHEGKLLGAVVRTRTGVKPIYVSVGHRVTLEDALELVSSCCPRYRIPEPIRAAHKEVNRLRQGIR